MSKALQRPKLKPSTPPSATAQPSELAPAEPVPAPEPQPQQQSREFHTRPQQYVTYLAHGMIQGKLDRTTGKLFLIPDRDDHLLPVSGIDAKCAVKLLCMDEDDRHQSRNWFVYPQSGSHRSLTWFIASFDPKHLLEPDQFRIWGSASNDGSAVFVGMNDLQLARFKKFTILPVQNTPATEPRQPVKWLCTRIGNELMYVGEDELPLPMQKRNTSSYP